MIHIAASEMRHNRTCDTTVSLRRNAHHSTTANTRKISMSNATKVYTGMIALALTLWIVASFATVVHNVRAVQVYDLPIGPMRGCS